jgi:hypothetical protein
MRLNGRWAPLAACLVAFGAAGCGASATTPPPTVNVSITAPTSGATVGVHRVVVAGTVTPANAQVIVGGQPAVVSGGKFTRSLWLANPTRVVTVTAQAPGYVAAHAATTINYSPSLAAQLVASAAALNPPPAPPPAKTSAAAIRALYHAVALPAASGSSRRSGSHATHSTPARATPTHATPAKTTPTPTTPPRSTPPGSTSGNGGQPVNNPPVMTAARIKQVWEAGCLKHTKGQSVVPYCTCIYNHLSATGTFKTPAAVTALLKKLHAYGKTGDLSTLSRKIRLAVTVCAAKLPALAPAAGQPTLTRLPGLSHKPVRFP